MKHLNSPKTAKNMEIDDPLQEGLFPIRTVSSLTGVNAITLRAWERRYGLITPHHTPKGNRFYTQHDIDLINRVVDLLEKGVSINQVGASLKQESQHADRVHVEPNPWSSRQQRMINAIVHFDQEALDNVYTEALSFYPTHIVTRKLIIPLLKTLQERWETTEGCIVEEHYFAAYLRNKLGARFHSTGQKLVAACLPGEYHEVGLLLFCLAVIMQNYRLVLLGANIPMDELPLVAQRSASNAIVLSGSLNSSLAALEAQLPALVGKTNVPVFVWGKTAIQYHDLIVRSGAIPIGDHINHGVKGIEEVLQGMASSH
jgi:DNA-binding transcriptional MerR regulator